LQVVVMLRLDIAFAVELELRLQVGEVANISPSGRREQLLPRRK
jgi:hypothetical protein